MGTTQNKMTWLLFVIGMSLVVLEMYLLWLECGPPSITPTLDRLRYVRLYIVTGTYPRPQQIPELTQLAQTLMHVPNLLWLVVEDAPCHTPQVAALLGKYRIPFHHLLVPVSPETISSRPDAESQRVLQRNVGLAWVMDNATLPGVVYFADADNTYDIQLFKEMRGTRQVSVWPVGLSSEQGVSSPVVDNGRLTGFFGSSPGDSTYPVHVAGFAVSLAFLIQSPNAEFPDRGNEEDNFLKRLEPLKLHEIELKADKCSKILVWHTPTKNVEPSAPLNMSIYGGTNIVKLKKLIA